MAKSASPFGSGKQVPAAASRWHTAATDMKRRQTVRPIWARPIIYARRHFTSLVCAISSEVTVAPGCDMRKKKKEEQKTESRWRSERPNSQTKLKISDDLLQTPRRSRVEENSPARSHQSCNLDEPHQKPDCSLLLAAIGGGGGDESRTVLDKNWIKMRQVFAWPFPKERWCCHWVERAHRSYTKRYWWRWREADEKWRRQT